MYLRTLLYFNLLELEAKGGPETMNVGRRTFHEGRMGESREITDKRPFLPNEE